MDTRRDFLKKVALAVLATMPSPVSAIAQPHARLTAKVVSSGVVGGLDNIGLHISKYITASVVDWIHSAGRVIDKKDYGDDMHEAVMQLLCRNPKTWLEVKLEIHEKLKGAVDLAQEIDGAFSDLRSHISFDDNGTRLNFTTMKHKIINLVNSSAAEIKRQHDFVNRKMKGLPPRPDFIDRAAAMKVGGYAPKGFVFRIQNPAAQNYEIPSQIH